MNIADILTKHPTATIEVQASADFYDGHIDFTADRETLAIPEWQAPNTEAASGRYGDEIDALVRTYVNPKALRALDFEDCADDDDSFDGHDYYYATLDGETAPDANGVRLPIAITVYVVRHDDKMLNPEVIIKIAELEAIAEEAKLGQKTIWPTDANRSLDEYKASHPKESACLINALNQCCEHCWAARNIAELENAYKYGLKWAANNRLKKEDIHRIAKKLVEYTLRADAARSKNMDRVFPNWDKVYANRRRADETQSLEMEPADAPDQIASENL